jgi:hypothetical protein
LVWRIAIKKTTGTLHRGSALQVADKDGANARCPSINGDCHRLQAAAV